MFSIPPFITQQFIPQQLDRFAQTRELLLKPITTYGDFVRRLTWVAPLIACLCFLISPPSLHSWRDFGTLTALVLATSLLAVRLPSDELTTYPGIPVLFTMAGLFGASAVVATTVICVLVEGFVAMSPHNRLKLKLYVPNIAGQVNVFGASALIYAALERLFFWHHGVRIGETPSWIACTALPFCTFAGFIGNALLATTLISFYEKKRWDIIWYNNIRWQMPSAILMSPLGLVTALIYNEHWWWGVGFIVVPMYALRLVILTHNRTLAAYRQGVELMGRMMQEAHPYTHGHLHRVARWAQKIAEEMHLPPSSMACIGDAAVLHDIGKVAVDDRVLNKVGRLTDDDWSMIKRHPVTGADLVLKMSVMGQVGHWIRHHHERPDGGGYPDGLAEDDIPIEASIISAVDAFDAMVGGPAKEDRRPYRKPMPVDAAVAELRRNAGTQFHAGVVSVFTAILEREREMEAAGLEVGPKPGLADDSLWSGSYDSAMPAYSV